MKPVVSLQLTDPVFSADKKYSAFDRFWIKRIRDERDLPFVYLTLRISLIMIPLGILLYIPGINGLVWWGIAIAYMFFNNFVFKGPFGLMLHCTSHRPWFNEKNKWLNYYLPWFVSPFFGQTPETYSVHHLAMHHRENNLEEDLSSTMHYQRDNFFSFLKYFSAFFFTVIPSLAGYFDKREQPKLRNKVIRGELAFWIACGLLCFISWEATLVVFVVPLLISRIIMMVGNWAQHSFIDKDDPGNFYKNSITCINTKYNNKCWNDGYHISHHIQPNLHWTKHPEHLLSNMKEYANNKALVFEGIHFLHVWYYLMTSNYSKLAKRVVNIHGMFSSEEEVIALMKARAVRIPK
ncbi:MAG TPA: fatty acid desaturase [Ohtaekwangia sp.]|nr:fatty acid desaturase [Ohtaekwangia sp.]